MFVDSNYRIHKSCKWHWAVGEIGQMRVRSGQVRVFNVHIQSKLL